jgi:hypothetical protein
MRLGASQSWSGLLEQQEIPYFNGIRNLDRPAGSESLYRMRSVLRFSQKYNNNNNFGETRNGAILDKNIYKCHTFSSAKRWMSVWVSESVSEWVSLPVCLSVSHQSVDGRSASRLWIHSNSQVTTQSVNRLISQTYVRPAGLPVNQSVCNKINYWSYTHYQGLNPPLPASVKHNPFSEADISSASPLILWTLTVRYCSPKTRHLPPYQARSIQSTPSKWSLSLGFSIKTYTKYYVWYHMKPHKNYSVPLTAVCEPPATYSGVCYNERSYNEWMLQRTILQRTNTTTNSFNQ